MAVGHQKKDKNPYCICLVMTVPKHSNHLNLLQRGKCGCPLIFSNIKASKCFQVSIKILKSTLDRGLAFAKKVLALVNLCVTNMYEWQKLLIVNRRTYTYETA
jgi:hypothetical protein